jgi:hypothetical protein
MNKKARVGLIVLITVILLLAVALPGLAKKTETYPCSYDGLMVHISGDYARTPIFGEMEAYWEDGVLYNICKGIIPWGEPIDPGAWRYATFEETCDYFGDSVTCTKTVLTITKEQWGGDVYLFDPVTGESIGPATDFNMIAHKYSGTFVGYEEYVPPE